MIVEDTLISRGGNSRLIVDPSTGVNKCGCRYQPESVLA
jgi:hypothetical protein